MAAVEANNVEQGTPAGKFTERLTADDMDPWRNAHANTPNGRVSYKQNAKAILREAKVFLKPAKLIQEEAHLQDGDGETFRAWRDQSKNALRVGEMTAMEYMFEGKVTIYV